MDPREYRLVEMETRSAASWLDRIMPPLGPRSVLWVSSSHYIRIGGWDSRGVPAATRPAIWAISTIEIGSRLVRDLPEFLKVNFPGIGAWPPAMIILGFSSRAILRTSS